MSALSAALGSLPSRTQRAGFGLSAKAALTLLWCGLFLAVPSRGQSGIELVAPAIGLCIVYLPVEYAAIAVALGPLLPNLFGSLPFWYTDKVRWGLVFCGAAVLWFRAAKASKRFRGRSATPFQALVTVYAAVALLTVGISTSISLSLSKWLVLVASLVSFSVGTRWVVGTYGPHSARQWVRAWIVMLLPILIGDVAALFFGFGQTFQLGAYRGLAGGANGLGVIVAFVLPLLACQFLYARRKPSSKHQATGILMAALAYLLILSWSRASVFACLVGVLIVWAVHPRNRLTRFALLGAVPLVAIAVVQPSRSFERVENWIYKGRTHESLTSAREEQWRLGYANFVKNPWLGSGFGVTSEYESEWSMGSFRYLKKEQGSSLLAMLGQVGLIGTVPMYLGMVLLLVRAALYAHAVRDPWFTGIVGSAWAGFANSFLEGWLAAPGSGLFWFMLFQCFFLHTVMSRLRPPARPASLQAFAPWGMPQARPAPSPVPAGTH